MPPTLRSSPEKGGGTRRSKRGLELPTHEQKQRKKKKSPTKQAPPKKAPSKAVAAAKEKTAEEEARKHAGEEVVVKKEAGPKPGRHKWTEEEDIACCQAHVNITADAIVGPNQKGDIFWQRIQKKMCEFHGKTAEVQSLEKWGFSAVNNGFSKIISKETQTSMVVGFK